MAFDKLQEELADTHLAKKQPKAEEGMNKEEVIERVVKFTNEARKHYGDMIKSVLIFGSIVRGDAVKTSDADVWVILDDTATKGTDDIDKVQSHLFLIAHELKDVHVQTTPLTEFWHWIKTGSPELVNFLRYGLPIYDSGFIKPVQRMLAMGLLPPSEETISIRARAAEARHRKVKLDMKSMVFELRYCASDIIQATVMHHYKAQPDLKDIPKFLEKLVQEGKLEAEWVENFQKMNKMWKDIDHKVVKDVDSAYLEGALVLSRRIIDRFKKLIPKEVLGEELPEED
ncbi:MAG: nucleotidyltransferase domain-containing protein [Candidatus Aenigmarchaeota archaeon]|nr:nucleotidyltransferase domain-containing protein [Candidatus Aenigmarchaeota archaeon]